MAKHTGRDLRDTPTNNLRNLYCCWEKNFFSWKQIFIKYMLPDRSSQILQRKRESSWLYLHIEDAC